VDAFLVVPQSLGISPETYTRDQFFGDMHAYIRFKTPEQSIPALLDDENRKSPLGRLRAAAADESPAAATAASQRTLAHEIRLFGCLVRARVRDRTRSLLARVHELDGTVSAPPLQVADLAAAATSLAQESARIVSAYRELRPAFVRPDLPAWLRETYTFTDEFLSLVVETNLTQLVAAFERAPALGSALAGARSALLELPRVYHINVVLQLRAIGKNAAPVLERVRVVTDRSGIRRLEEA